MASALWAAAERDASPIAIVTAGGDELQVGLTPVPTPGVEPGTRRSGEPPRARWGVRLTGPAEVVFRGEWTESAPAAATVAADA